MRVFNTSKDKYSFSSYLSEVASPHDMSILNNNDITQDIEANKLEPSAHLKTVFMLLPQAETVENIEALLP